MISSNDSESRDNRGDAKLRSIADGLRHADCADGKRLLVWLLKE